MLEVRGIHTYYGQSHILFDVSLSLRRGEIVGLLGRNGVITSYSIHYTKLYERILSGG